MISNAMTFVYVHPAIQILEAVLQSVPPHTPEGALVARPPALPTASGMEPPTGGAWGSASTLSGEETEPPPALLFTTFDAPFVRRVFVCVFVCFYSVLQYVANAYHRKISYGRRNMKRKKR